MMEYYKSNAYQSLQRRGQTFFICHVPTNGWHDEHTISYIHYTHSNTQVH